MPSFIETPRFPENISYGSSGGPGFKTFIFEGHSGIEQRNIAWSRARGHWNVAHGVRDKSDMDALRAFFYNAAGRALGFRFKDWGDYELDQEAIGTGDGSNPTFPITKTYSAGNPYVRRIFKPVSGTLVVRVNSVVQTEGAGASKYQVDYTTGIITFGASAIPAIGHVVDVTGEFDVPVRFDTDQMSAAHDGFLVESWANIPIVELLLEEP